MSPGAVVIYDGQCPFCERYVELMRLRERLGPVVLVDARAGGAHVEQARAAGHDLDQGMILKIGERYYSGAECMHMIARLTEDDGLVDRLHTAVFYSERRARWLYPWLRAGRNATLALLGRARIGPSSKP